MEPSPERPCEQLGDASAREGEAEVDMKGGDDGMEAQCSTQQVQNSAVDCLSDVSSLQDRGNLEIDRCFRYMADNLVDGDWTVVEEEEGVTVSHLKCVESGLCWVRARKFCGQFSYDDKVWTALPEVISELDISLLFKVTVVNLLSPGDATVRMEFRDPDIAQSSKLIHGSLHHHFRLSIRNHFPRPNILCSVVAPPTFGDSATTFTHVFLMEVLQVPGGSLVSHYTQLPWTELPAWAIPNMLQLSKLGENRFRPEDNICPQLRSFYVVLSLKTCSRGAPLVPTKSEKATASESSSGQESCYQAGGYSWSAYQFEDSDGFALPRYLTKFFQAMGYQIPVWDSLSGRFLVPWQAVIRGCDWEAVSEEFMATFQSSRSLYRWMYGGRNTPKVKLGKEPHYLNLWTTEVPELDHDLLLERNTFVNVSRLRRVRMAAEYP